MLGVIHRCILGIGPAHFKEFFRLAPPFSGQGHRYQLVDVRTAGSANTLLNRLAFGLIAVYNMLPGSVFSGKGVKQFQRNLQDLIKQRATAGWENWADTLSPRLPMATHPLRIC